MQMQIEVGQAKVEFQHKGQQEEGARVKVVQIEAKIIHKVRNHQTLVGRPRGTERRSTFSRGAGCTRWRGSQWRRQQRKPKSQPRTTNCWLRQG